MSAVSSLIQDLLNGSARPHKETVEMLDKLPIQRQGISTRELQTLIHILTDPYSKVSQSLKRHIIREYLYFRGTVPTKVVYAICGALGANATRDADKRLPPLIQQQLVLWLVTVYAYLEDPHIIQKLYGVLFNLLEFGFLRGPVTHLLFLATQKQHVTESRVNRLVNMYAKDTQSEPVIALALMYQEFAPELVLNVFPKISHKVFKSPNVQYAYALAQLHKDNKRTRLSMAKEIKDFDEFTEKLKKRKTGIPGLDYTSSLAVSHTQNLSTVRDLVLCLEKLDLPRDWDSILLDHTGMSLLAFVVRNDDDEKGRFDEWIEMNMESLTAMKVPRQKQVLEMVKQYVDMTGDVRSPITQSFLLNESVHFDHPALSEYVWHFLSKLSLKHIDDIEVTTTLFNRVLVNASADFSCSYLKTLSVVMVNCYNARPNSKNLKILSTIIKETLICIPEKLHKTRYDLTIAYGAVELIKVLQRVPVSLLKVQDVVLAPNIIYTLLFMDDPVIFSEICGHLNFSKTILKTGENSEEVLHLTNLHNSYVVDICNLAWRNKAFDIPKTSTAAFGLTRDFTNSFAAALPIFDRNSGFKQLFNIHHTSAFAGYSAKIVRSLENEDDSCTTRHEGPLTTNSMQDLMRDPDLHWLKVQDPEDVRVEVLKRLEAMGYVGLSELLFSHLKSLVNKRQSVG